MSDGSASRIEAEGEWLRKFGVSLKTEDKPAFQDMIGKLRSCELHKSLIRGFESPVRQIPLMIALLWIHHKMINDLNKDALSVL